MTNLEAAVLAQAGGLEAERDLRVRWRILARAVAEEVERRQRGGPEPLVLVLGGEYVPRERVTCRARGVPQGGWP